MIEALVKHIEDQDLTIQVQPMVLHISKKRGDKELVMHWSIAPIMLQSLPQEILFAEADQKIKEFYQQYNQAE